MTENIREYAKVGLVHHLLYQNSTLNSEIHERTLLEFIKRTDIEAFDCCLPYGEEKRNRLIPEIRKLKNIDVGYSIHLFPMRKISLGTLDINEKELIKIFMKNQIEIAEKIGATGFVFVSGIDIPQNRTLAYESFKDFCKWFCEQLAPYNINALLEPFDREIDKKFLFGPIDDCLELINSVKNSYKNIGIELDMAHLPLMGEDFVESIKKCGKDILRVHLGNCVLKDKNNPLYGDMHPPMGIVGGEIGKKELETILKALIDIHYLSKSDRKPLIIEMTPFPGKTIEFTVENNFELLNKAFSKIF